MRILTFTSLFPNQKDPNRGIFIYQRVSHLARRGHDITVVAPVPYSPKWIWWGKGPRFAQIARQERIGELCTYHPRYPLIPKISMPMHGFAMALATLPLVRELHRRSAFDCIDAHYVYPDGFAAALLGKALKIPVVVSARGTDMNLFPSFRLIHPMIRWTMGRVAGGIGVSQALLEKMLESGLPQEKAAVVGNGVDLARFQPVDRIMARKMLQIPLQSEMLLTVAALLPVKGIEKLIEAMSRLRSCRPNVRLYVIGAGYLLRDLQALTRKLNLDGSVVFLGTIRNDELKTWYSAADAMCLASSREGWPNVLLESMACGTPVVATRVGGIPDVISSSEVGILVDDSVESIMNGINRSLDTCWRRELIVSYAEKRTWDKVASELEIALQQWCRPLLHPAGTTG